MRSLVTLLAIIFCALVLTSCTDEAKELEERIENETQIHLVDREDIERPGEQGSN